MGMGMFLELGRGMLNAKFQLMYARQQSSIRHTISYKHTPAPMAMVGAIKYGNIENKQFRIPHPLIETNLFGQSIGE